MLTKHLRYGNGYSGRMGNKCWIASITGTSGQYGLERSFLPPDDIWREHPNRSRTMIEMTWRLDVGLYEMSAQGDRWFVAVWIKDDEYVFTILGEDRVKAMADLMDGGMLADDARRATKPAAKTQTTQGV